MESEFTKADAPNDFVEINVPKDFTPAEPSAEPFFPKSSTGGIGPSDPIGEAIVHKSDAFINEGLERFLKPKFKKPTSNSSQAILDYLKANYKSFKTNSDCSYTQMDLRDTQHFVKNLDQAYEEILNSGTADTANFNNTLSEFLTGTQLAVVPTSKMVRYYNIKNTITSGLFVTKGFSVAALAKTIPVNARAAYLISPTGGNLVATSFILGTAFSMLEDMTPAPWRIPKMFFGSLKWSTLLPAKGAEVVINGALAPFEILACGIPLPSNSTKALVAGPGLTIRDISRKEVKKALDVALRKLGEN